MRLRVGELGDWSSGMILASGARGREFDSRITPYIFLIFFISAGVKKKNHKNNLEEQGFDPCACRLRTDRSTE